MNGQMMALDASTAILLAKVSLLRQVVAKGEVWMAESAAAEATAKDSEDARVIAQLIEEEQIRLASVREEVDRLVLDFRLAAGEAETIALARKKQALCVTDDGPAIRCCKVIGIPFATAITFLVGLAESDELKAELALELLAKLQKSGRYGVRILEDATRGVRAAAKGGRL